MSFAIFEEGFYLASYPDVKAAVDAKRFNSGLEHFQKQGLAEGRTSVSAFYNEQLYLQKYPDVARDVSGAGTLKSGLQHYIEYGEAEGRSPGAFDELAYRQKYPDVNAAIAAGAFSSGLQHFIRHGQFEPTRLGIFTGTTGNDTITGLGAATNLIGIDVQNPIPDGTGTLNFTNTNYGFGEVDTLIGGSGRDLFYLGATTTLASSSNLPKSFYVGSSSADYAIIRNFERGKDVITLAGSSLSSYNLG